MRAEPMSVLMFGALACALLASVSADAAPHPGPAYVEGEVLVTFKTQVDLPAVSKLLQARSITSARHFAEVSKFKHRNMLLARAKGRTTASLVSELQEDPNVERVEPNYLRWVASDAGPNDTLFSQQWALHNTGQIVNGFLGTTGDDIKFIESWPDASVGTNAPVVAIIDSGIDYTHPDLVNNLWVNPGDIPGNGIDEDGNGYVDDRYGFDFVDGIADPMDSGVHGTHLAGIIAATGNNQLGIVGVSPQARVMALKVSTDGDTMNDAAVIGALEYVTLMKKRGVNIVAINASFGGGGSSSMERDAIQAVGDAGIVFCAAAGNEGTDNGMYPFYPANYRLNNMIVVAATDQNDALASFSNFSTNLVDLAAPGVNILSTVRPTDATTSAAVRTDNVEYSANGLTGAAVTAGVTGQIVDCGLGRSWEFPDKTAGNIAVIARGSIYFSDKLANAKTAGAGAVVIYNNSSGNFTGTLIYPVDSIPAVTLSKEDGLALLNSHPSSATVVNVPDHRSYSLQDGTSMSAAFVSGAVALAARSFPNESVTERVGRILASVDKIPCLQTSCRTGGRLNLKGVYGQSSLPQSGSIAIREPMMTDTGIQFTITSSNADASLLILTATNLSILATNWTVVGSPVKIAPGQFQFTAPASGNDQQRFFRVQRQ